MIYLFLADGFEDMEAIVPFDLIKRNGHSIVTVGVTGKIVSSAHGLSVICDITEDDVDMNKADGVILPGGMPGATNLKKSEKVTEYVKYAKDYNILISSICASPGVVLSTIGVLDGHRYTCFPGFETERGKYTGNDVEVDGCLITANGPMSAYKFGEAICKYFETKGKF